MIVILGIVISYLNVFLIWIHINGLFILKIDHTVEGEQVSFCKKIKAERDASAVQTTLENLRKVAASDGNTFEAILECSRVYVSVGEMCDVLREVWGEYVETSAAMSVS